MKRNTAFFVVLIFSFLSYFYGLLTIQYQIFPFELIRATKNLITGNAGNASPYYLHKKSFFETFGQKEYDIVFIGDSITDGAEWEDMFPKYKIANRGIGGDTTSGILNRMDSILSTQASKAFIMVGINDFSRGDAVDTVFNNYKIIVERLKRSGLKVYIQSTILAGNRSSGLNEKINSLNSKLKTFSEKNNLTYIDLNNKLSENGLLSTAFTLDDVHLNGEGYKAWKASIKKHIAID